MSGLLHSEAKGDFAQNNDRTLVSMTSFYNEFYTYTAGTNSTTFAPTGVFTIVSGADFTTCPAGRVLHLTGRKLYPDVNPMTTFVGVLSAKKFLVGVYDPISFLRGFIDPASNTFAKFDQNLPNFFDLGTAGSGVVPPLGGATATNVGGALNVTSRIAGQATLVAGTIAITVTGVTTSSLAFVSLVSFVGAALTVNHRVVCTANTVTISALIAGGAGGSINVGDTSVVNYFVVN